MNRLFKLPLAAFACVALLLIADTAFASWTCVQGHWSGCWEDGVEACGLLHGKPLDSAECTTHGGGGGKNCTYTCAGGERVICNKSTPCKKAKVKGDRQKPGAGKTGKPVKSVAGGICNRRCTKSKNKKKCVEACVKRFKACGKQCGKRPKKTQKKCMKDCMGTPPTNLKKPNKSMLKAAHSGRCLDVPAFKKTNGVRIHQWDCNGKGNQRWTMDGIGRIKNRHSGKCLDIKGGQAKNGAPVLQWDCHKKKRQRWQMTPGGQIKSQLGNQCLAIKGWNKKNRGALVIWKCKKDANQKFSIH